MERESCEVTCQTRQGLVTDAPGWFSRARWAKRWARLEQRKRRKRDKFVGCTVVCQLRDE